jgi:hypothetical protein
MKCDFTGCNAHSLKNDTMCYQHSSKVSKERHSSRVRGGKKRKRYVQSIEYQTIHDIQTALSKVLNELMASNTDILPRSRAVSLLSSTLILCIEKGSIEDRLSELERKIEDRITN